MSKIDHRPSVGWCEKKEKDREKREAVKCGVYSGDGHMKRMFLLVTTLSMVVAACGQGGTETASGASDTTVAEQASTEPFCDAAIQTEIVAAAGPDVDFETATDDEIGAAIGDFAGRLEPLLDDLETHTPPDLKEPVDTITALLRESLETGEPVFQQPVFFEAEALVDQYVLANCEVGQMSVTGIDYEFQGVPETMTAGTVALDFTNEGGEVHEMVVFRINDGVTESVGELLDLPDEEVERKIQFVGSAFAEPGSGDVGFVELSAGNYAVVCFIPVGAIKTEALESGELGESPPHFTVGMVAEFTVED
jgi:hypothetical protein